jgi:hypothetical protein
MKRFLLNRTLLLVFLAILILGLLAFGQYLMVLRNAQLL